MTASYLSRRLGPVLFLATWTAFPSPRGRDPVARGRSRPRRPHRRPRRRDSPSRSLAERTRRGAARRHADPALPAEMAGSRAAEIERRLVLARRPESSRALFEGLAPGRWVLAWSGPGISCRRDGRGRSPRADALCRRAAPSRTVAGGKRARRPRDGRGRSTGRRPDRLRPVRRHAPPRDHREERRRRRVQARRSPGRRGPHVGGEGRRARGVEGPARRRDVAPRRPQRRSG